jgi:hypothetical protein
VTYVLAFAGAILVGLSLGLLGAGGSILTVPVLVYLVGEPHKPAIAESLLIVGAIATAGSIRYQRLGLVDWRTVILMGVPGMLGAFLGATLSRLLSGHVQLLVFGLVAIAAAGRMLTMRKTPDEFTPTKREPWQPILVGIGIGLLTGIVGVGGGFLIVPALVVFLGLPMRGAIGTSLVIIVANCLVGFAKQWIGHHEELPIHWWVVGLFAAVGAVGSVAGAALAPKLPQAKLRIAFGWVLVAIGLATVVIESAALVRANPGGG